MIAVRKKHMSVLTVLIDPTTTSDTDVVLTRPDGAGLNDNLSKHRSIRRHGSREWRHSARHRDFHISRKFKEERRGCLSVNFRDLKQGE